MEDVATKAEQVVSKNKAVMLEVNILSLFLDTKHVKADWKKHL